MKTEKVLNDLANEAHRPGDHVQIKKHDAKLILARINALESMAAALLRSQHDANQSIVLEIPFNAKAE